MEPIPTHNAPKRLELSDGSAVLVKRIARRSTLSKLMARVGHKAGDDASDLRLATLMLRAGIVGAEGLVDPDTGHAVEFSTVIEPGVGTVASELVSDCVPGDDVERVIGVISGDGGQVKADADVLPPAEEFVDGLLAEELSGPDLGN